MMTKSARKEVYTDARHNIIGLCLVQYLLSYIESNYLTC